MRRTLEVYGIAALLIGLCLVLARAALGQELSAPNPVEPGTTARSNPLARTGGSKRATTPLAAHRQAQSCFGEATWNHHGCIAIHHIYRKRAADSERLDWYQMMLRYSAPLHGRTARSRELLRYPWGDVPGKSDRFNRKWGKLRELTTDLVAGLIPDNCEKALHFGGLMDVPRGRMVAATCAAQGLTANILYVLGPRIGES